MNVEQEIRSLKDRLQLLERGDLDMNGRRVKNAGRALSGSDLLTLGQARDMLSSPEATRLLEQRIETVGGGPFGIPVSLGDTNQQGSSSQYADAQHVHASGLTTKGDLLTYSTTLARLGVGTTGEQLYALSTATPGIAWGSGWKGAKTKTLTNGATTSLFEVALTTLLFAGGTIIYTAHAADAGAVEVEAGTVSYATTNNGGVYDVTFTTQDAAQSGGAPTVSWSGTGAANKITVKVTVSGSMLTPTSVSVRYFLFTPDAQVVTFL